MIIFVYLLMHHNTERTAYDAHVHSKHDEDTLGREFTVEGHRKDVNTIFLKLRIADSSGSLSLPLFNI